MKEKRNWLWEFSKKIVWIVTIMFVAVFLFCCVLLIFYPDSLAIQFVIDNISDVFKVTVVSYAVKAGFENVFKIKKDKGDGHYDGNVDSQLGSDSDCGSGNSRAD